MLESLVVGHGETFCTEWEEIAYDWAMLLMPGPLRDSNFCSDDGKELAPKRETGDRGNDPERGDIEGIDVGVVDEVSTDCQNRGVGKGNDCCERSSFGQDQRPEGGKKEKGCEWYLKDHDG